TIALLDYSLRRGRGTGVALVFFFQAEDGIRDRNVTGVQTCALPISSPNRFINANTSGSVSFVGITSSNFKYLGGLKKCVPRKCLRKSLEQSADIFSTDIPDVLELTIVPSFRYRST